MVISWISCHSTWLVKTRADYSVLPVLATAIHCNGKHLNTIIGVVGPVQVIVYPIKRKAIDESSANRQYCRRVTVNV